MSAAERIAADRAGRVDAPPAYEDSFQDGGAEAEAAAPVEEEEVECPVCFELIEEMPPPPP
jgi:hypothetical protein